MIRHTLIALTLPLAMSTAAFADGAASTASGGTEYLRQAAAGKWEVTPGLEYHDFSIKYGNDQGNTLTKDEFTGESVAVKGEYGINDMFSAGIKLMYTTDTNKMSGGSPGTTFSNGTNSGLNNLDLYGIGNYDLGMGKLHYGLNLDVSMSKNKCTVTGNGQTGTNISTACNQDTGGTSATPWVGYDMDLGPGSIGTKLSWSFLLSNRSLGVTDSTSSPSASISTTETGGQLISWTVFYEYNMAPWKFGLALSWNTVNSTSDTTVGVTTKEDSGHAGMLVDLYAPVTVTDTITILPNLEFGDPGTVLVGQNGVKTYSGMAIGCGARFVF